MRLPAKPSPLAKQIRENRDRRRRQEQERHDRNEKVLSSVRQQTGRSA